MSRPKITLLWRSDSSSDWTMNDPILMEGEAGFESDTGKFKVGNGYSPWHLLSYFLDEDGVALLIQDVVSNLGIGVVDPRIGNLLNLTTVDKTSIVNAINEVDADTTPAISLTLLYDNAKAG